MHYEKYGKVAVWNILEHSDRGIEQTDNRNHSNESIDPERTHLNYDLKDRGGLTAYAYYKQRIDTIAEETKKRTGKALRKDAVTLCSWLVTAPQDLPPDKYEEFFKGAYEWFADRYGEDNIVTAAVHMDETTPHMHFQFTPIVEKDSIVKLCAKDMETPRTLKRVHQDLQKYLTDKLDFPVNLLNGATANGAKTIAQLKADRIKAENERLVQENTELKADSERLVQENAELKEQITRYLDYEQPPKAFGEFQKRYDERVATGQQAHAVKQRSKDLDDREKQLAQRQQLADQRERELSQRQAELDRAVQKAREDGYKDGKARGMEQQVQADSVALNAVRADVTKLQRTLEHQEQAHAKDFERLNKWLSSEYSIDTDVSEVVQVLEEEEKRQARRRFRGR